MGARSIIEAQAWERVKYQDERLADSVPPVHQQESIGHIVSENAQISGGFVSEETPAWAASGPATWEHPGPCATAPGLSPSSNSPAPL
jgi:hypothetical protein